jgi:hypothetical protein
MAHLNWASCLAVTALLFNPIAAQAATSPVGAYLSNPSVRLWYEATGRLSDNIAPPRTFALWNTIIGEGDAEEDANDVLFTVDLKSDGEQNIPQALTLTATDSKGKVLAKRILPSLLTSKDGNATPGLWVRDVGCAGAVTFSAQLGANKRTVKLNFDCGE